MAMTTDDMIVFFGEQAEGAGEGMQAAQSSANYYLATVNCVERFKCRLMQGLIRWRMGSAPTDFLTLAVRGFSSDWEILVAIGGDNAKLSDTPAEKVPFLSCLIGQQVVPIDIDGLEGDRLLDAVLGRWLCGSWDVTHWEQGIEHLHSSRSKLALDTYELYKAVAHASPSDLSALMENGKNLFKKRRTDRFFSGGDQTEGGGNDNDVTVDYRLASLVKHAGYEGEGARAWQW